MRNKLTRSQRRGVWLMVFASLLQLPLAALSQTGPASVLYLTAGDQNTMFAIQGGNVLRSWSEINNNEYAIAVMGTVQTTIGATGFLGHEYTTNGTYTGVAYTFPNLPGTSVYDGTSDGTHIYGWDFNQNRVIRFDSDWSDPVPLFSIGGAVGDYMGIAFDPANKSLWISGWNTSQICDYSLTGQLLSSFSVSHNENAALALDPATETMWLANRNEYGLFEEYSRSGTLLSTEFYPELSGMNVLGGEFQSVPEPAPAALLVLGFLLFRNFRAKPRPATQD